MIEYLEKLIQDKEFKQALAYAEQLMASRELSPSDFVAVQCCLLTARSYLGEYEAALVVGQVALSAARDLGDWDHYVTACWDMGATYYRLKRIDDAIHAWYELLANLHLCKNVTEREALTWYNIAVAQTAKGESTEAIKALERAMSAANHFGNHRQAHGFRHALIEACLSSGQLEPIPSLLAKCLHYLRHNPEADSLLWHYKLRAEFALASNRPRRALQVALKGFGMSAESKLHHAYFHMLLAKVGEQEGRPEIALGHLLAAGLSAASCRRSDLEAEAANGFYRLLAADKGLISHMDRYCISSDLGVLRDAE